MSAIRPKIRVSKTPSPDIRPQTFCLEEGVLKIGRNSDNTIVLPDALVSRYHAEVHFDGTECLIRDVGGKNPVRVNGEEVDRRVLAHGDTITIGGVEMVFESQAPPPLKVVKDADAGGAAALSVDTATVNFDRRLMVGTPPGEKDYRLLHRLYRLSEELLSIEEEEALYDVVLACAAEETHAERGLLGLAGAVDQANPSGLNVVRFWNPVEESRSRGLEMSETILNQITRERRAVLVSNVPDRFDASQTVHDLKIRSYVCAPMVHGERFIGLIYVDTRDKRGPLDQSDLEFVGAVARVAGLALETLRIQHGLRTENARLRKMIFSTTELIGQHESITAILALIEKVASRETSVLIAGENGTGKEVIAKAIHARSQRKDLPFVAVNCGAVPANLVESELFGYEKGAFTGAEKTTEGKFDFAQGGTLFLDEVGEMPLDMQVKLLRVLQERRFYRVGGKKEIETDVRILSATNQNLAKAIEAGKFREDLYYRLAVVTVAIPPLRERGNDIALIAEHFLRQAGGKVTVTQPAMDCLLNYHWPGNVRELRNTLEQAIVLGDGCRISPQDLPAHIGKSARGRMTFRLKPLTEVEKQYILRVLEETEGNKARAASILGISRETLYQKLKQYEIRASDA